MRDHKTGFSGATWLTVTVAYVATYSMTNGFFTPLENILAPNIPSNVSLMFIPHGVRVLTFYFFGLWGYLYLAPVVWVMWALEVYGQSNDGYLSIGIFISLFACHFGVEICKRLFQTNGKQGGLGFNWKQLLAAGTIGSLLNSTGLTWLYNSTFEPLTFAGYLFGDVAGQFFLMLLLIFFFRLASRSTAITDRV